MTHWHREIWLGARSRDGFVFVRDVQSEGQEDVVYQAIEADVRRYARAAGIPVHESEAYRLEGATPTGDH